MFIDPELFGVAPWISGQPPEDTLKRWKSACNIVNNRRRKFRMVANLANQAETRVNTFKIQVLFYALLSVLYYFSLLKQSCFEQSVNSTLIFSLSIE